MSGADAETIPDPPRAFGVGDLPPSARPLAAVMRDVTCWNIVESVLSKSFNFFFSSEMSPFLNGASQLPIIVEIISIGTAAHAKERCEREGMLDGA